MEEPEIHQVGSVFTLTWHDRFLQIRLDRFSTDRKQTSAEITVKTNHPSSSQVLHQARLNLSSSRARSELVKILHTRRDLPDWDIVIEQVCLRVLQRLREGEPIHNLETVVLEAEPLDLLAPIIYEKQITLLFGPGGSGKSLLALWWALLISHGINHDSTNFKAKKTNVLYLDWEASLHDTKKRYELLKKGLGLPDDDQFRMHYRRCVVPLADETEVIQAICAEHEIGLVIIDSVALACGGELKESAPILTFYQAIRALNCAALCIDHPPKPTEGKETKPYGSVFKETYPRCSWLIKGVQEEGSAYLNIGLYHDKRNNTGKLKPIGLRLQFSEDSVTVHYQEIGNIPELAMKLSLTKRIQLELRSGLMATTELADSLGKSTTEIRVRLNEGQKQGIFVKIGEKWGNAQEEPVENSENENIF